MDSEKGVSAISLNSEKAIQYSQRLRKNAVWIETAAEQVAVDNPALLRDHAENIPALRGKIYGEIKSNGWTSVERKYLYARNRLVKQIWYSLPISVTKGIKKIVKRGRM